MIKTHPLIIFGDRVFQNMYFIPPTEYLAQQSPERVLQTTLDRIRERAGVEDSLSALERRFHSAIDNFPYTLVIYDPDLRYIHINERGLKDAGLQETDMIGRTNEEIWPPEVYGLFIDELRKARETGTITSAIFTTPYAGGVQTVETIFVPIFDDDGALESILGVSYDRSAPVTG